MADESENPANRTGNPTSNPRGYIIPMWHPQVRLGVSGDVRADRTPPSGLGGATKAGRVFRCFLAALGLLLIALVVGAVFAQGGSVIKGGHWLRAAISGRLFLVCSALTVGCLIALLVLSRALWLAGAAHRQKGVSPEGGAVIVEFAMVLPFVLIFVTIMVQSMLMMAGLLCVHYAAFCAARTAVVQVPANVLSSNEPPNFVDLGAAVKLSRIKASAVWPLIPVSCGSSDYPVSQTCTDLQTGLTSYFSGFNQVVPGWITTQLPQRFSYAMDMTVVTLSPPISGGLYAEHEDIVVNVEHTFYLSFPFMAKIFKTIGNGVDLNFGQGNYGLPMQAGCRLSNEGVQDFVDEEKFDDAGGAAPI